jgi:hypothetical protein
VASLCRLAAQLQPLARNAARPAPLDGTGSQANLLPAETGREIEQTEDGIARQRSPQYGRSEPVAATDNLSSQRFYHGTRADLKPGDLIEPGHPPDIGERDRMTTYVYLTPNLDAAI